MTQDRHKLAPTKASGSCSREDAVLAILRRLAAAFPSQTPITEQTLEVYLEHLTDYPPETLARACESWIRTGKFWPKVAELRERADQCARQQPTERRLELPESTATSTHPTVQAALAKISKALGRGKGG